MSHIIHIALSPDESLCSFNIKIKYKALEEYYVISNNLCALL